MISKVEKDIESLKYEIRCAEQENASAYELNMLYYELDDLLQQLHKEQDDARYN